MRSLAFIMTALAVISLAFWAYSENYLTQSTLGKTDTLRRDIGQARARLAVLKAEWAYLNRPDRLRDLTEINFNRLQLLPLRPDQFGKIDQVPFAKPNEQPITGALADVVDVMSVNDLDKP